MRHSVTGAFLALTFAMGITACAPVPVQGQAVAVGPTVAFSYSDGYWDRDHRWHRWRNAAEHRYYREHYADHYYKVRHDRGHHNGWREERWWDHRG